MPGNVPPVADEREGLLGYLSQQRYVLRTAAYGLTERQIRATPAASALSVGGLLKHVAAVERHWIGEVIRRNDPPGPVRTDVDYNAGFQLADGETLTSLLAVYDDIAVETGAVIAGISDLGEPVPIPKGVPWFPQDIEAWSVRWVLLHVIEETARHAGHADIVRESIDGATAFSLMAAAEGWPESPWIKPWRPAAQG